MMFRCLLLCVLFLPFPAAIAATEDLTERARVLQLAADPQWRALLHINRGGTLRDRGRSYIDDPAFFLAGNGADDPQAELDATVRALFVDGDATARCRYVARYRWLAGKLGAAPYEPLALCAEYAEWRTPMPAGRVTLVFPGSYLNSPSSMFGHTLLRIDPPADADSSVLLSWAISFGADIVPGDNSILYIWKGIGGGYPGRFMVEQYFAKIQQYGRMENRDLWEYPLDLTATETAFLVDHLWELRGIRFDYYFFDENCSYRLLEILEAARPGLKLTDDFRLSEVPVNTIRGVADAGIAQAPVLRPSAERELRARVENLNPAERELALGFFAGQARTDDPAFVALPRDRQAAVLATAYAQIVYRARKVVGRDALMAERSLALLREINASGEKPLAQVVPPAAPEQGHRTRRLWLGGGGQSPGGLDGAGDDFVILGWRPSYHDLLDPPTGYLRGAELEILDTELRVYDDGDVKLERLDAARVFSLAPRDRFFPSLSWQVRGGIAREPLPDDRYGSARFIEGGGGVAYGVGEVLLRAFGELRIEHNGAHEHLLDVAVAPAVGMYGQHDRIGWTLDARPLFFGGGFVRTEAKFGLQWHAGRDLGLRAGLRWRNADDSGLDREITDADLALHYYF
ncbi:MAG: DUF4105 domain-containing protein [Pseudomonadota bacterium]